MAAITSASISPSLPSTASSSSPFTPTCGSTSSRTTPSSTVAASDCSISPGPSLHTPIPPIPLPPTSAAPCTPYGGIVAALRSHAVDEESTAAGRLNGPLSPSATQGLPPFNPIPRSLVESTLAVSPEAMAPIGDEQRLISGADSAILACQRSQTDVSMGMVVADVAISRVRDAWIGLRRDSLMHSISHHADTRTSLPPGRPVGATGKPRSSSLPSVASSSACDQPQSRQTTCQTHAQNSSTSAGVASANLALARISAALRLHSSAQLPYFPPDCAFSSHPIDTKPDRVLCAASACPATSVISALISKNSCAVLTAGAPL
ncbi:hypothetical protein A4X13_0g8320 [Tilletia indica]|uniref:Uncharacterized protein n=1 Tax=Tilletia indica TaxID=43049 RepID=A0A177SZC9_9BASI|nr:hypothetical protein A4X13_0g8320 [Tilletia indica]